MRWHRTTRTRALVGVPVAALAVVAVVVAGTHAAEESEGRFDNAAEKYASGEIELDSADGEANGGEGGEAAELRRSMEQYAPARTAPGIVAPGAYSSAFTALQALPATGQSWTELTRVPYDADDPDYRDYYSNSSGGAGLVTGRVTALAVGGGAVYAAGADGGVWRSTTGTGNWQPIADRLPSLSSGDLQVDRTGALWYGTGEANTGSTSYVGSGVYRLANPKSGAFSTADRIGGTELESTGVHHLRFAGDTVFAATQRGLYSHSANGPAGEPWKLLYTPNPDFMPGGAKAGDPDAGYKNIVNDVAVDPRNPTHVIAAVGWRGGDTYNGFYESTDGGTTWAKINPTGAINPKDVGYATFAFAADGSKLYVVNESVKLYNQGTGTAAANSLLDGIYVSNTGNPVGPWNKIADSTKLANSGSALKQSTGGKGYGPGVQAWYNQFLAVDPTNADHVYAGLEEVYETRNAGSSWTTPGPYWNFTFPCWRVDGLYAPNGSRGCSQTTHSDQHAVAIGTVAGGAPYVYVGNDGGVYRRPVSGAADTSGHATDWQSLNDGTLDALQYYYVGVGKLQADDAKRPDLTTGEQVLVSGGLQDNGGSLLRPGAPKMVSNFGGDGGDVLVDPNDGCNIVQEYVVLSLEVTQTCANPGSGHPNAFLDKSDATTFDIAPPDVNARFIAPFTANEMNIDEWLAGGNSLWYQDNGFAIRSGSEWQKVYTFGSISRVATSVAFRGDKAIAGYCGPCNNAGFTRGVVVGLKSPSGSWSFNEVVAPSSTAIPNRYVAGAAIDAAGNLYVVMNGFSRRFTEGPGAGVGHVFKSTDNGATWTDVSGNFPDVPANSIVVLQSGGLVVGTDLGVVYKSASSSTWQRLGGNFPTTVAIDVERGPDGNVYAATHGRGLWRISASGL